MKNRFRHNFWLGLTLVTALFSLVPTSVFATGETAYLTPASGTSQPGAQFTVSVDGYVGQQWWGGGANNASGSVTFPANLLKVVSSSTTGSSFTASNSVTSDNTNGTISFNETANGFSPPANETVHLFSITFQSLAAGTAGVKFGTVTYTTGTAATTGGTYTIVSPAPAPTPTPTPTTTPKPKTPTKPKTPVVTPAPTPTPTPTPTVENTPAPTSNSDGGLKVEDVNVTATRSENSIAWLLNNATATPTLQYGTDKNKLTDAGTIPQLADGSYKLELKNLKLGTLYYFTIKAATNDNLQGANYSGTLTTRGYPVQLTIEQNNLLIPGARVTLSGRSFVADNNAIVTTELNYGNNTASITPPGSTTAYSVPFSVKKLVIPYNGNPNLQSFTLSIKTVGTSSGKTISLLPMIVGGLVGSVVVLGLAGYGVFFYLKKNREKIAGQPLQDVDTGQLQRAYGMEIEKHTINTPEPNLGGDFSAQVAEPVASVPSPENGMPPLPPALQPEAVDLSRQAQAAPELPKPGSDPAVLAIPTASTAQNLTMDPEAQVEPTSESQVVQSYADQPVTQPVNEDSNAELQEQALAKVEASEQSSSEPSATYDAATGELAIIHHHVAAAAAETSQGPLNKPTRQGAG